jgi:hypothetical protein
VPSLRVTALKEGVPLAQAGSNAAGEGLKGGVLGEPKRRGADGWKRGGGLARGGSRLGRGGQRRSAEEVEEGVAVSMGRVSLGKNVA